MTSQEEELEVRDRNAWRDWLAANHGPSPGVWLVFHKTRTEAARLRYGEAVEEALCFGWIDGKLRKLDEERYMRRFTPRRAGSKWSPTNKQRVKRLIAAGRMRPSGQAKVDAAKQDGSWEAPDRPELPTEPTPEFAAALAESPQARRFFDSLPPSERGRFIAWIAVAKRDTTRQRRLTESIALLERGERLGMR